MITIDLPDRTIDISFSHPVIKKIIQKHVDSRVVESFEVKRRQTICEIAEVKENGALKVLARAIVNCHYKDNFNRDAGRKTAMRRAMIFTYLSKKERQMIWIAYHLRNAKPVEAESIKEAVH